MSEHWKHFLRSDLFIYLFKLFAFSFTGRVLQKTLLVLITELLRQINTFCTKTTRSVVSWEMKFSLDGVSKTKLVHVKILKWAPVLTIFQNVTHTLAQPHVLSHLLCKEVLSLLRGGEAFRWAEAGVQGEAVGAIQGMLCGLHDLTCLWSWRGSRPLTQGSKTRKMKKGDRVGGFRL